MLLTPHPSASDMLTRARTGTMVGGMTCAAYADSKTKALDGRLAKEAAAQ
jgi:metallo-beta-lactamase class B